MATENVENSEPYLKPSAKQEESSTAAPLPARLLAALIDYCILYAFLSLGARVLGLFDSAFLITLLLGGLYYSAGNSWPLSGQTLGKRVFGLKVVQLSPQDRPWLSFFAGSFRFLMLFGILIVLVEFPPLFYRAEGFVAPLPTLEAHMFVALAYFFFTVFLVIFTEQHRGIHDLAAGSMVIRQIGIESPEPLSVAISGKKVSYKALLACAFAALLVTIVLWLPGVVQRPELMAIHEQRYALENEFPLRIVGVEALRVDEGRETLTLRAFLLPSRWEMIHAPEEIGRQVVQYLQDRQKLSSSDFQSIVVQFTTASPKGEILEESYEQSLVH